MSMKRLFILSFICAFGILGTAGSDAQAADKRVFLKGNVNTADVRSGTKLFVPRANRYEQTNTFVPRSSSTTAKTPSTVKRVYNAPQSTVKSQGTAIYNAQRSTVKSYVSKNLNVDVPKVSTSSVASLRDTAREDAQVEASRLKLAALEKSRIAGIASKFKSVSLSSIKGFAGGLIGGATDRVSRGVTSRVNSVRDVAQDEVDAIRGGANRQIQGNYSLR